MLVDERWDEMLGLAQKINHWALGHYRAAMEDHNTWEMFHSQWQKKDASWKDLDERKQFTYLL